MTPEYLEAMADLADPDKLWQISGFAQMDLPADRRRQLDCGVALRRYASHLRELAVAMEAGKSLLITPLTTSSTARRMVDTPPDHKEMREKRWPATTPGLPHKLVAVDGPSF